MVLRNSLLGVDVAENVQLLLVFSAHAFFLSGYAVETREFCGTVLASNRVFPHPAREDSAECQGKETIEEMKVEVLYFEGCPNHAPTVDRVREELQSNGLPNEIREVEVRTQAEAEALGFLGSPTVRIDAL